MSFSSSILKRKLRTLICSQECIKTLSRWLIHNRKHHETIVEEWLKLVLRAGEQMAMSYMYLANDVIQNSIEKGPEIKIAFATVLPKALAYIGGKFTSAKLFSRLLRILDIWQHRAVYSFKMIADYRKLLIDVSDDDDGSAEEDSNSDSTPTTTDDNSYGYAGKLIEALANIEHSPSSDADSRQRVITMPASLLKIDLTAKVEDRKEVVEKLKEAAEQLDEYNALLEAELHDRSRLSRLLLRFRKEQVHEIQYAEQRLKKYKKRLATLKSIQEELRTHTANLPHVLSGVPPLPTLGELFSKRSN